MQSAGSCPSLSVSNRSSRCMSADNASAAKRGVASPELRNESRACWCCHGKGHKTIAVVQTPKPTDLCVMKCPFGQIAAKQVVLTHRADLPASGVLCCLDDHAARASIRACRDA